MIHFFCPFPPCNADDKKNFSTVLCRANKLNYFFLLLRLPLTWKPPFGYLLIWFMESTTVFCAFLTSLPYMTISIGFCWLLIAIAKEITNNLSNLKSSKASTFRRRKHEFKAHLCKIIQLHSHLKQLSYFQK